jgi:hypothetical protein
MNPLWILGAMVVIAIVVVAVSRAAAKRRREATAAWAEEHGFQHTGEQVDAESLQLGLRTLLRGRKPTVCNVLEGQWRGCRVLAFDFRYVTGSGKHRHVHRYTAAVAATEDQLRSVEIRPENFLDKVAAFFGSVDVQFPARDDFNRRFRVHAADPEWTRRALPDASLDALLAAAPIELEMHGRSLAVLRRGVVPVTAIESLLDLATSLVEAIPAGASRA